MAIQGATEVATLKEYGAKEAMRVKTLFRRLRDERHLIGVLGPVIAICMQN